MHTTAAESANRTQVALLLAGTLAGHGATADQAAALPDLGWRLAVEATALTVDPDDWTPAEDYTPSAATRAAVVTVLRSRERTDPFAGFPR